MILTDTIPRFLLLTSQSQDMSEYTWPTTLQANAKLLSQEEKEMANMLSKLDQDHLFESWEAPGTNDDAKHAFFAQVAELNKSYGSTGKGIKEYVERARVLLESSKKGENPFEGEEFLSSFVSSLSFIIYSLFFILFLLS